MGRAVRIFLIFFWSLKFKFLASRSALRFDYLGHSEASGWVFDWFINDWLALRYFQTWSTDILPNCFLSVLNKQWGLHWCWLHVAIGRACQMHREGCHTWAVLCLFGERPFRWAHSSDYASPHQNKGFSEVLRCGAIKDLFTRKPVPSTTTTTISRCAIKVINIITKITKCF